VTHCRQVMLEELQRRNFAPTTISSYLHAVEQFARHFKCRPDRLNQTHFRSYQAYLLRERKMQPLTVRLHVAALRFFFVKTLKRRYLLDDTPYPKAPRRLPQILSVEEMARVIDAAGSLSHRTMLMVLYSTGMRNAELRHLQVADIDSRRMLIHIQRGKGGRDRYVPLSPTLLTTLRMYYRWMRPKTWLFPGTVDGWRADKPITPKILWEACVVAARRARLRKRCSPHLVRHSYATHLLESGGPPDDSAAPRSRGDSAHGAVSPSLAHASAGRRESPGRADPLDARHCATHPAETPAVTRPPFEVADIVRQHGDHFLETHRTWTTGQHRRVLRAIAQCRTAALGGHRDRCDARAHPALSYNSCRDRHCPKCLTAARNGWVAAREQELLPVGYVHVVFTVPEPLARLAPANKRVVYDPLFRAAAATLLQVAANPKRLGAAIGASWSLHTWAQPRTTFAGSSRRSAAIEMRSSTCCGPYRSRSGDTSSDW
jgi:integrase/recombinase XerD